MIAITNILVAAQLLLQTDQFQRLQMSTPVSQCQRLRQHLQGYGLLCASLALATPVMAMPVGFKDSWMTMGSFGRSWSEASGMYTFTAKDAVSVDAISARKLGAERNQRLDMLSVHYNRRLARWNLPQAQANIYLLLGAGAARGDALRGPATDSTQAVALPGIQLDYETRRVYAAVQWHGYYAKTFRGTRSAASAGFSFYATEYDEWQPWAIIEVSKMGRDFRDDTETTPYLRLIHKTLFIETGVPFKDGKADGLKVNFRYTF